jgi:tetratricopeptide (TPR) repeat protein
MRRAILQIGTEKTGTTSLQSFLAANRDRLRQRGFAYPRFCGEINHTGLAAYAMAPGRFDPLRARYGIHDREDVAPMRQRMALAAAAELAGDETVIFCNEHCHSRLVRLEEVVTLRDFLRVFFDRIDIAIYLRRQDQVAVSLYSTRLKSGGTGSDVLPRTNGEDHYFNYDRSLRLWEEAFGQDRVTVRLFDRADLVRGSVVADFLQTWNIGAPEDFAETPNQNESVSPEAQEFLRRINAHLKAPEGLALETILGPASSRLARHFPGSGAKPDRASAIAFYDMYRPSNEAIRARHFPDRDRLFSDDFSSYPEEPALQQTSLDDFGRIAARLLTEMTLENRRLEAEIAIRDARMHWGRKEDGAADRALQRALSWSPRHAPVHRVVGEYMLEQGRFEEAEKAARRAVELREESFEFWHFLGIVLRRRGDLDGAEAAQIRALGINASHNGAKVSLEQVREERAAQRARRA